MLKLHIKKYFYVDLLSQAVILHSNNEISYRYCLHCLRYNSQQTHAPKKVQIKQQV